MISENIIAYIRQSLSGVYPEREASAVARCVAEERYGITMVAAYSGMARKLTDEEQAELDSVIARLKKGEPVQYVLGCASFMGREFHVERGVLIPRPETEMLVERVLTDVGNADCQLRMVDAGTGSGAIAISLKCALPRAEVSAFDVSATALRVAADNAKRLEADVNFFTADMLSPDLPLETYDVIVSNPPYVRQSEREEMTVQVKDYEPELALFVPDEDPLVFYRALAKWGKSVLKSGGALYVEINSALGKETSEMFRAEGYEEVRLYKDQFEKDRIVVCRR